MSAVADPESVGHAGPLPRRGTSAADAIETEIEVSRHGVNHLAQSSSSSPRLPIHQEELLEIPLGITAHQERLVAVVDVGPSRHSLSAIETCGTAYIANSISSRAQKESTWKHVCSSAVRRTTMPVATWLRDDIKVNRSDL
jgi:hypothetical protein